MPTKSSPRFHQEAIRPIKLPLSDAESFDMKSFWFARKKNHISLLHINLLSINDIQSLLQGTEPLALEVVDMMFNG